jgi:hypothetical protein
MRTTRLSLLAVTLLGVIACSETTAPSTATLETREARALVNVDAISIAPSDLVTWAPAPGQCAKGALWTGCPRINYAVRGYVNGVFIGYLETRHWSSSNESIATITNKGRADVIGGPGVTIITATYGGLTATTTLTTQ